MLDPVWPDPAPVADLPDLDPVASSSRVVHGLSGQVQALLGSSGKTNLKYIFHFF